MAVGPAASAARRSWILHGVDLGTEEARAHGFPAPAFAGCAFAQLLGQALQCLNSAL